MTRQLHVFAAVAAAFLLAGCDPQTATPTGPATLGKLPAKVCATVAESLTKLAEGIFEHDGKGSATISEADWYSLASGGKGQLARALAVDAACKQSNAPREMQVFIRAAESGRILSNRTVEIAPGADMFFESE